MFIVNKRKIFYSISIVLIALSFFSIFKHGLNFGIDFTGGSVAEVKYQSDMPSVTDINSRLSSVGVSDAVVVQAGDDGYIIKTKTLDEQKRKEVVSVIGGQVERFDSIGPVLGRELTEKAIWSLVLVILAIIIFITFVFRKVSRPVSSWKYGMVLIVALIHDIIIPLGAFSFLGRAGGYEIDSLFITAILVILGFSIHDTIVVFDRTRENIKVVGLDKKPFDQIVGMSLTHTISRSINTTLTTLFALGALYIFGPDSTRGFSLVLIIGITAGVYSSIFIASPMLVTLEKWQKRKDK